MPGSHWRLRTRDLDLGSIKIMGILNTTPDSFYDQGRYRLHEAALARAREMAEEGADIIDIGGEKAGPGPAVSVNEEIDRVCPMVEAVARETGIPVSVDTFKEPVAAAAVQAGAEIINSIGGFKDPGIRQVAAESRAAVIVMHIQGQPRVPHPHPEYQDVAEDVRTWLLDRAETCERDGIDTDRIAIDPGPGFGKSTDHDLEVLRRLDVLTNSPYPVVLAASRKPFIGAVLDLPPGERLEGSLAVSVWGAMHGVSVIRTHDVRATRRAVRMIEAVLDPDGVEAHA